MGKKPNMGFIKRRDRYFRFAKTMPDNPHYYVRRADVEEADYVALWHAINKHGTWELYEGRRYKCLYHDGWKYWYMGALYQSRIINRARVDDAETPQ
jgi:hypothetical protein